VALHVDDDQWRVEADGTMVVRRGAQQVNALVPPQRG